MTMMTPEEAQKRLKNITFEQKCRLYTPNGKFEEALKKLDLPTWEPGQVNIFVIRANNRAGKTTFITNLIAYMTEGFQNKWFDQIDYLRSMKRPNRGRIYTTINAAKTTYQDIIKEWFPKADFTAKQGGYVFNSEFTSKKGSKFDLFTFDRDPKENESLHLDWAVIDEPMPYKLWTGTKSRLDTGGPIFFVFTALEGSSWVRYEIEKIERMGKDVFVTEIDAEDCCKIHGIRGHLAHAYIESLAADCDEDELSARVHGKYIHLAGTIFKKFSRNVHVIKEMPEHLKQWWKDKDYTLVQITDPHDRKPFALGWYAVFPNEDTVCIAEWPDENYSSIPFHKIKDCAFVPKDYAKIMISIEQALEKHAHKRLMDPNFGKTPCFSSKKTVTDELIAESKELKYPLTFTFANDDIQQGHIAVKNLIGDPSKNMRSKFYIMEYCFNHIFAFENYGWKENKNMLSEKPELVYKDFIDLVRYGAMGYFKYYRPTVQAQDLYTPKVRGNGYRGA